MAKEEAIVKGTIEIPLSTPNLEILQNKDGANSWFQGLQVLKVLPQFDGEGEKVMKNFEQLPLHTKEVYISASI